MAGALVISLFRCCRDVSPRARSWDWPQLARLLTTFNARRCKDGPLWSPASYAPGSTRCNESVLTVSLFVLDIDSGARPEVFSRLFEPYAHVAHSTWSHAEDLPRWRAVFPLVEPVLGYEWPGVYRKLATHLGKGMADMSCADAARMYLLPSSPVERQWCQMATVREGRLLDPLAFAEIADFGPDQSTRRKRGPGVPRPSFGRVDLASVVAGNVPDGQKHFLLIRAIRKLRAMRVDGETAKRLVEIAIRNIGEARLRESMESAIRRYLSEVDRCYAKFPAGPEGAER